jgi:hypothetical protein
MILTTSIDFEIIGTCILVSVVSFAFIYTREFKEG